MAKKAKTITLFQGVETILKEQVKANTKFGTVQHAYQILACSVIEHVKLHSDVTVMNTFIERMPEGLPRNPMRDFFLKFANVVYDTDTKQFKFDGRKPVNLEEALTTNWWKTFKEPDYKPADTLADLKELTVKLSRRMQKLRPDKGDHVTQSEIAVLEQAISAIRDIRATETEAQQAA